MTRRLGVAVGVSIRGGGRRWLAMRGGVNSGCGDRQMIAGLLARARYGRGMPPAQLHSYAPPAKEHFTTIVRGSGAQVWDAAGNTYVDGMSSLWYCAVGHGRREIAEAIAAQASTLAHFSTFDPFTTETSDRLAERIVPLAPMPDARVFFTSSGSEAIDSAMKLSRVAHRLSGQAQRTMFISRERGYHGVNFGGTSAQGIAPNREGWGPLIPGVMQVGGDDLEALSVLMAQHSNNLAGIITEPVQGAGGVFPAQPGYLEGVRRLCDQHGAHMIADEVICGFGRLGTWSGSEFFGVTPDLATFAKAITSGYQPLGGVYVGGVVRQALEADPTYILRHGYTYSGHATACAAGLANLDILQGEELLSRAAFIEGRLGAGLHSLFGDGQLAQVRGTRGIWGVTLPEGVNAMAVREAMFARGVIIRAIPTSTVVMCPPLVVTESQLDQMVDALAGAITEVMGTMSPMSATSV
jgi:putrescine---pyruvate transaminase